MAHTGFSYGVDTVSSPGPYPEKVPPLFPFSSNIRYIIFSKPYFDHILHPSKDIHEREEERALSWRKMNDSLTMYSFCAAVSGERHVHGDG